LRVVLEEQAGTQILFYGRGPSAADMFARMEEIIVGDMKRVAAKYTHDQGYVVTTIRQTEPMVDYFLV
jgi:hypothetical protein